MSSKYLTFDYTRKLPNISFAAIEDHAWACGIAVVSQRIEDPRSRSIEVYTSYLGHLYVVINDLWRLALKGRLGELSDASSEARTFIPDDIFAYRFSRWASPGASGKITADQLARIHILAERAMGGFIAEAAASSPRGHLTAEGMNRARRLELSLKEHLSRCPTYVDTPRPDEVDFMMEGDQIKIRFRGDVCAAFRAKAEDVEAALAANLVAADKVCEVTKESLEVFWSVDFQGFKVDGLEVRVTEGRVTWVPGQGRKVVCPDGTEEALKTVTRNNENFKYFLAQVALRR